VCPSSGCLRSSVGSALDKLLNLEIAVSIIPFKIQGPYVCPGAVILLVSVLSAVTMTLLCRARYTTYVTKPVSISFTMPDLQWGKTVRSLIEWHAWCSIGLPHGQRIPTPSRRYLFTRIAFSLGVLQNNGDWNQKERFLRIDVVCWHL